MGEANLQRSGMRADAVAMWSCSYLSSGGNTSMFNASKSKEQSSDGSEGGNRVGCGATMLWMGKGERGMVDG